jgi:hypothetical protein
MAKAPKATPSTPGGILGDTNFALFQLEKSTAAFPPSQTRAINSVLPFIA